jgi:hypothetical protein
MSTPKDHHDQSFSHLPLSRPRVFDLGFAEFKFREDGIVELKIAADVHLTAGLALQSIKLIKQHLRLPVALLVNRSNSYTCSEEALDLLNSSNLPFLTATAIVVYNQDDAIVAEFLKEISPLLGRTEAVEVFQDYDQAVAWLLELLARAK